MRSAASRRAAASWASSAPRALTIRLSVRWTRSHRSPRLSVALVHDPVASFDPPRSISHAPLPQLVASTTRYFDAARCVLDDVAARDLVSARRDRKLRAARSTTRLRADHMRIRESSPETYSIVVKKNRHPKWERTAHASGGSAGARVALTGRRSAISQKKLVRTAPARS